MQWSFEALDAKQALGLRRSFTAFLRELCTIGSDCDAAQIVLGELVGNVIRHAPGPIQILLRNEGDRVILEVWDEGRGFAMAPTLPPLTAEGGRGLYIVSQLCPDVSVHRSGGRTGVSARLPVAPLSRLAAGSPN